MRAGWGMHLEEDPSVIREADCVADELDAETAWLAVRWVADWQDRLLASSSV